MGTKMWDRGQIIWGTNNNMIIIASGVVITIITYFEFILVPLTLLVCMILLGVFLRWLPGVLLPIVAVAITAEMVVI